jgi:hypothetical protein
MQPVEADLTGAQSSPEAIAFASPHPRGLVNAMAISGACRTADPGEHRTPGNAR